MNAKGPIPLRKVLRKLGIASSLYYVAEKHPFDWISAAVKYKKYFNKDFLFSINVRPDPQNPQVNYITIEKPIEDNAFPKIVTKGNRQKQNFMKKRPELMERMSAVSDISLFVMAVTKIIDIGSSIEDSANYQEKLELKTTLLIYLLKQHMEISSNEKHVVELSPHFMTLHELQNFTDSIPALIEGRKQSDDVGKVGINILALLRQVMKFADLNILKWKFCVGKLDWSRYIKLLFENVENVDLENRENFEKIMVYDVDYLRDIISFIKQYSHHFEALLWFDAVQLLLFFTTADLRKLAFEFVHEPTVPMRRLCRELTVESMDLAVAYPLIDEKAKVYKSEVTEMADNLKHVLGKIVEKSSWLDENTKNITHEKIKKMRSYVSHPYWLTNATALDKYYEKFKIDENEFLQTVMNINEALVEMNLKTLQRPVYEQNFCGASVLEMNAFYYPRDNAMCIPRGIILFPFYGHPIQALNYGTLGTIVGHEISHGFDHESKIFVQKHSNDSDDSMLKEYRRRKSCFVESFDHIEVGLLGFTVNGKRTVKENIADHGGIEEAFKAYQLYRQKNGPDQLLPGFENFTSEQLFTLAFANLWCEENTIFTLFTQVISDEHSPNEARVVGTLKNFGSFTDIWKCPAGSRMNPSKKCELW